MNFTNWLITIFITFSCVFITYPDFKDYPNMYFSREWHIAYQSTARSWWAFAVAYLIYACETYNGGIVKRILTFKFWFPLSRLSYSAYLIHTTVIFYFYATQEHPMHIQVSDIVNFVISCQLQNLSRLILFLNIQDLQLCFEFGFLVRFGVFCDLIF